MHEKLIAFLQSSNLVSASTATEIASIFRLKEFSKGDFVLTAGKICDDYNFITSGFMRSFAHDTEGNEVTTNFFSQGHIVFEVASFFQRTRSMENIQALTNCECLTITYAELNHLFHALPEFREFGRSVLVRGYANLKNRMLSTITETAEQRYATLLQTKPEIFQHAPLKMIASYLGITDSSLSRIRKEYAAK